MAALEFTFAWMLIPLTVGGLIAGSLWRRRFVLAHSVALRGAGCAGLGLVVLGALLPAGAIARPALLLGSLLLVLSLWNAVASRCDRARGLRKLGRVAEAWDWDRFEAEFRAYVNRRADRPSGRG